MKQSFANLVQLKHRLSTSTCDVATITSEKSMEEIIGCFSILPRSSSRVRVRGPLRPSVFLVETFRTTPGRITPAGKTCGCLVAAMRYMVSPIEVTRSVGSQIGKEVLYKRRQIEVMLGMTCQRLGSLRLQV